VTGLFYGLLAGWLWRRGGRGGRDPGETALVIALRDLDSIPVLLRFEVLQTSYNQATHMAHYEHFLLDKLARLTNFLEPRWGRTSNFFGPHRLTPSKAI